MKILVTGSAGFIGSNLCEALVKAGHAVVGIDCFTPYYSVALKELNAKHIQDLGVETKRLDLATDNLDGAVCGFDVIFHLAAQPGISAQVSFEDYLKNNLVATNRLVEASSKDLKLKMFINIGTSSIYGLNATLDEEQAPRPASNYGVTKLAAEQLVLSYQREKKIKACSLRLFSVYGPRERPDKMFPKAILSVLKGSEFPLYEGSEKHLRSYTYVEDTVAGITSVLKNLAKVEGEIINIGSDKCFSTREALDLVEKHAGGKIKKVVVPRVLGDQVRTHANIEKARLLLGYNPKYDLDSGVKKTCLWYKENLNRFL